MNGLKMENSTHGGSSINQWVISFKVDMEPELSWDKWYKNVGKLVWESMLMLWLTIWVEVETMCGQCTEMEVGDGAQLGDQRILQPDLLTLLMTGCSKTLIILDWDLDLNILQYHIFQLISIVRGLWTHGLTHFNWIMDGLLVLLI